MVLQGDMLLRGDWPGRLVVLSGPSGVGKTAISDRLLEGEICTRAITATTRAPRDGEVEGVDYFFLPDREAFLADVAQGRFLEHAEVHGNLYGTPIAPLQKRLEAGEVVLLVIDVQGATALMDRGVGGTFVFVEPPSLEELERRLCGRDSDDADAQRLRLENARRELTYRERYDHRVVNDDLDQAIQQLTKLLAGRETERS